MKKRGIFFIPLSFLYIFCICPLPVSERILNRKKVFPIETRIALIGIVVENKDCIKELNNLLSQYSSYIIGRMGIPYREKEISIISIAIDAPQNIISALSGKIGMLPGISTKTIYSKTMPEI